MKFIYPEGATPIDLDEAHALIPQHIQTQEELNAFESLNIANAIPWALRQKKILNVQFLKQLHKHMLSKTWKWAGQFRKTQKNIGVEVYRINTALHELCDNTSFQIEHNSFDVDEIAIRFHHKLVFIHAFVNGNGRHARLMADLLIQQLGRPLFSWGARTYNYQDLSSLNNMRLAYITALRKADAYDYGPLIEFSRS